MSMAGTIQRKFASIVSKIGGRSRQQATLSRSRERTFVGVEPLEERVQMAATPMLPDLTPLANKPKAYMYGWQLDRAEKPGRTLLRLTTAIATVVVALIVTLNVFLLYQTFFGG